MAGLEALLLFVVVPLIASAGAIAAGWAAYSNLRARADSENPGPKSMGKFIVYPPVVATPVVFGLVLWILSFPIAATIDSPTPHIGAVFAGPLLFDAGIMFATVAVVQAIAQAWIARSRMAQFVGEDFGRVQPLLVVPETATIFALTLVFLVLGRIEDLLAGSSSPSGVALDSVIYSLGLYGVGSVALLVGTGLANQIEDLKGRGFGQALLRQELGIFLLIVLFANAFLAFQNL